MHDAAHLVSEQYPSVAVFFQGISLEYFVPSGSKKGSPLPRTQGRLSERVLSCVVKPNTLK